MTRNNKKRGFTMIEVLVAVGVLTVGSLGVLAMQQTIVKSNRSARDMNHAMTALQTWMGRLERDAMLWTVPQNNALALAPTQYIKELVTTNQTPWFRPDSDIDGEEYGFDYFGNETDDEARIKYCANIRLSWLRSGRSARVDVRVYWMNEGRAGTTPGWVAGSAFANSDCDASDADNWLPDDASTAPAPNVNAVYASSIVRFTGADRAVTP